MLSFVLGLFVTPLAKAQVNVPVTINDDGGSVGGTLTIPVNVDFTGTAGIIGYDLTFTYDPAILTITGVTAGDVGFSAPTGNDDDMDGMVTYAAASATPSTASGVLFNIEVTLASGGSTTVDATGDFQDQNDDNNPAVVDAGTITVTDAANNEPDANNDNASTDENTAVEIEVLDNDSDPDGDPLTVTNVTDPPNGTAAIINGGDEGDPQISYTPDAGFDGQDSFTYTISDGRGGTDQAVVFVTVNDTVNEDPTVDNPINNQTLFEGGDTFIINNLNSVFDDPNGDDLSFGAMSDNTSAATVSVNGNQLVVTSQSIGGATITVTADDGRGGMVTDAFDVTVIEQPNRPPVIDLPIPDRVAAVGDMFDIDLSNVFSDPDGDPLTFVADATPPGFLGFSVNGNILTVQVLGADPAPINVSVTAEDGNGGAVTDVFTVTILAENDNNPPVVSSALSDVVLNVEDPPFTTDLSSAFSDPDGDPLSFAAASADRTVATVSVDGNTLTVSPVSAGSTTVRVSAADASGASVTTTFIVTVVAEGDVFTAMLSGANEVPANGSQGTGTVTATIDGNTLTVTGSFSGLESDFATMIGAHIHLGFAGQNGPVIFPLNPTLTGDQRGGTFEAANNTFTLGQGDVSAEMQIEAFRNRRYYVNIHSVDIPSGELRGQLIPNDGAGKQAQADALLRAVFSGRAEVPPNSSQAVGGAVVELRGNTLILSGAFSGLESDFATNIGAHLHRAGLGENGDVIFPLTVDVVEDNSGTFAPGVNTFALSNDQVQAVLEGEFYVNIHSVDFPAGEIRGQVLPVDSRTVEATLAGRNEVPPVMSGATGAVLGVVDDDNMLTISGMFSGLESDFATNIGAHLHLAPVSQNGDVVFPLSVELMDDNRSGSFEAGDNVFELSNEQVEALLHGGFYVNVHTQENPSGELRGQVLVSTNVAPNAAALTSPAAGATVDITGDPATPLTVTWDAASDPNNNTVAYRWQLALDPAFNVVLIDSSSGTATMLSTFYGAVGPLLTANGIGLGQSITLFHRVVTTDGSFQTAGEAFEITLTRSTLTNSEDARGLPAAFLLHGNYPNPFNPATTISFDLDRSAEVSLEVLDILGRLVLSVPARTYAPGNAHAIEVDATDLASGTYLYRIRVRGNSETVTSTGQMLLIK